jgi:hypothetical protein
MELKTTLIALGAVLGVASACGEGPTPPSLSPPYGPTALRLDLVTPHTDDGAVVVTLKGPGVSTLRPASPAYLAYSRADSAENEVRLIVIGDLKGGALATVSIAAGHQLSDYTATIQQVASRGDTLRADLAGYRVSVTNY